VQTLSVPRSKVFGVAADLSGMSLSTVEYGSLTSEAVSPRLTLIPVASTEPQEVLEGDEALVAQDNHIGGCLRGVFFAILFQATVLSLCVLVFKIWRMVR
jgi:hypothetical protein